MGGRATGRRRVMSVPLIYTLKEAAAMLHMSTDYLRSRLYDRTFPAVKLAGRWHMTEDQVVEAIGIMSTPARVEVKSPATSPARGRTPSVAFAALTRRRIESQALRRSDRL